MINYKECDDNDFIKRGIEKHKIVKPEPKDL